jgi:NADPH-dependent 2,4-dienoyl-CoA reductase/sulfur reductase-like enzyme
MTFHAVKVLVVGGSYGGIATALNLLNLSTNRATRFGAAFKFPTGVPEDPSFDIHIVDERDGYGKLNVIMLRWYADLLQVHFIGCPLAFASNEYAPKIWRKFEDIPALQHPNIRWTHGSVVNVDTETLTARVRHAGTNKESSHAYDYLVVASGLKRAFPVVPQSLTRKQYLHEAANHIRDVQEAQEGVVVIGGGAVGVEMAAELKYVQPNQKVTLIHSRDRLLSSEPLPAECSDLTIEALKAMDVALILGQRVLGTTEVTNEVGKKVHRVTLQNGSELLAGRVIYAISRSIATSSYLPAAALDSAGEVKIKSLFVLTYYMPASHSNTL